MTLDELVNALSALPEQPLQIRLPDDSFVPAHFHVTEVGRVRKDFVDCGGTFRSSESCVLQVWVANDVDHRLHTTKLAQIIGKGLRLFESTAVPVEIEYDRGAISQYPLVNCEVTPDAVRLQLGSKHTACLAPELCGNPLDVLSSSCAAPGCCEPAPLAAQGLSLE